MKNIYYKKIRGNVTLIDFIIYDFPAVTPFAIMKLK